MAAVAGNFILVGATRCAGSAHEALDGIAASARFFPGNDLQSGREIFVIDMWTGF
jgi:hypothetical protein